MDSCSGEMFTISASMLAMAATRHPGLERIDSYFMGFEEENNISLGRCDLTGKINLINNKEIKLKSKVITLETDNDHYLSKIHQYEEEVTDLKDNLENTLESLITTQNDFEEYKNKKEEELERLKKILKEEKENVKALMNKKLINNKVQLDLQNDEIENIKKEIEQENKIKNENEKIRLRGRKKNNNNNNKNISYNKNELFEKLRKRKENLIKFNQKIKEEKKNLDKKQVKYNF